jgi:hypothetical protein
VLGVNCILLLYDNLRRFNMSNNALSGPESPLRVNVEDGELVVRVGINRLDGHECHNKIPELKFDNREEWVRDVIAEIDREEEDGATPLNTMLDNAMEAALEQGSIGVAEDGFTFKGECSGCGDDCVPLRHTRNGVMCPECV